MTISPLSKYNLCYLKYKYRSKYNFHFKIVRWLILTIYEVPFFSFNYKTFLYLLKYELISFTEVICSYCILTTLFARKFEF